MKTIHRTRNFIIAAFLLSLLFHASSILYIVVTKSNRTNQDLLQEQEEPDKPRIKKEDEWAETKARASNFGAPVMFEDDPEKTWQDTQQTEEIIEPEPIQKPEEKIIEKPLPEEKIIPEKEEISIEIPTEQKSIPRQNKPPQKKRPIKQKKATPRSSTADRPRPPLSLAQLTQGFLNHVKDEGTHAIHMLGKKSGQPSDEQIKYERYLQKLGWCLQNSFNINNSRIPASATSESTVYVQLALNKDGTMRNCNVARSSGNASLDKFTLFIFNDASTSFPPVPTYLPHDPFTITYVITHSLREQNGMSLYRR